MKYRAICDVCGFEFFNFELTRRWDEAMVCSKDYEERHPMDFIKTVTEDQKLPWTRPEPADTFVEVEYTIPLEAVPSGTFNQEL